VKLVVTCPFPEVYGAEIVSVERMGREQWGRGGRWVAHLVDGSNLTLFGDEIEVRS